MTSEEYYLNVQVLYQLSWEGRLEHPHMITVHYLSGQDGLRLRDVKKRLTALRGQGIGHSFSWSNKRNYKSTFIWNDLSDDDVIHPLRGSGEYVLKASELIDAFANKQAGNHTEHQNEQKQSALTPQISRGCGLDQSNQAVDRHSRTMSVDKLAIGAERPGDSKKDESTKGVAVDILQNLPALSVEQETIDVAKSDFCLSSSDNEISPRPMKMTNSKAVKDHVLVVMTRSPTVQGLQTPSHSRVISPTEAPFSPGSARRLWTREIRKSLFRTRNTNASPSSEKHEIASQNICENATSQGEASPIKSSHEDHPSLCRDSRSKSVGTFSLNGTKEKEKEVEQSTSQLIRLLWARWTGGSSKGKRISNSTCEASPTSHLCEDAKATKTKAKPLFDLCQSRTKSPCKEIASPTQVNKTEIPREEPPLRPAQEATLHFDEKPAEGEIAATNTPSPQPGTQELRAEQTHASLSNLQVVLDSPATDTQGGPPDAEIETPKPAMARSDFKSVKNSNGLPKVKTSVSPKSLPPGFHKGTNDTKPVQTPRRSFRSSIPLASSPLRRSLSKPDGTRSFTGMGTITTSPDQDSLTFTPSSQKSIHEIKKYINFCERDERPLLPGVTTLDWDKALQEAAIDCLPPPNFREFLQECSTCGRTFKPDSLQVHMRGCHPPQYARAFTLRASPHMLRSRAP